MKKGCKRVVKGLRKGREMTLSHQECFPYCASWFYVHFQKKIMGNSFGVVNERMNARQEFILVTKELNFHSHEASSTRVQVEAMKKRIKKESRKYS